MVEGAQRHGLDVTTECYPYTAGSTALQSAIFDPGWQEAMGITYNHRGARRGRTNQHS